MTTARKSSLTSATSEKSGCTRLLNYIEKQSATLARERKFGTSRNYIKARNSIQAFLKGKDIPLKAMNADLILEYNDWLTERGITRNTISFYMRILRSIYNKAVTQRLVRQTHPFSNVYTGIDKTRKRALDESGLEKIMTLDLSDSPGLTMTRDLFVFSFCMRGMSFVDIAFLRKRDINGKRISYLRQKTGRQLTIMMEPCIENIVKRYLEKTKDSPYVFPIIFSNDPQTAYNQYEAALGRHNRRLKELASMANLNIPLSSYCARHSWATAARNHNVPVSVITAAMGHSSESTTLIYLDSLEDSVIDKANHCVLESVNKMVSL